MVTVTRLPSGGSSSNLTTVYRWEVRKSQPLALDFAHARKRSGGICWPEFSPDGQRVLTVSGDFTARVWDARTGRAVSEPLYHRNLVCLAHFSPDGRLVATTDDDASARVWDARTGEPLTAPLQHGDRVVDVRFSPDGRRIVTASSDGTARVWEARTGQPVGKPLQHRKDPAASSETDEHAAEFGESADIEPSDVLTARFSPDGRHVVTTCQDGGVRIWDAVTGQLIGGPLPHLDLIAHLRFTPDGSRLVTASADGRGRVWDALTGQPLNEPVPHLQGMANDSPGRSPDGSRVIILSRNTAQVWDIRSGKRVGNVMTHSASLVTAQFSPDGTRVALGSVDGTVRLWDVQTALPVSGLLPHGGEVQHAEFSADGKWLLTAASDGKARLWEILVVAAPISRWLPELAEAVVGQRLTENDVRETVSPEQLWNLREQLTAGEGTDFYMRWAKWFFAPSATRALSPSSPITVPEYVQRRIEEDTLESLREAVSLAPTNAVALARLGRATVAQNEGVDPRKNGESDALIRWAMELAPDEPHVLCAHVEWLDRIRPSAEALALVEEHLQQQPSSPGLWQAKGEFLDITGQGEEADRAFTQALELAGAKAPSADLAPRNTAAALRLAATFEPASRFALGLRGAVGDDASHTGGVLRHEQARRCEAWRGAGCPAGADALAGRASAPVGPEGMEELPILGEGAVPNRQFTAAAESLQAEGRMRGGRPSLRSLLFLAMTHQRLGEPGKAKECWAEADQSWRTNFHGLGQSQKADLVALRLEAEQVLWRSLAKNKWKIVSASFEAKGDGDASLAIDGDPTTFWHTGGHPPPQEIVVDLGEMLELTAFAYLPRQQGRWGMTDQYEFYLSTDGQDWKEPAAKGEFADLREYPIQQTVPFTRPVTARYFRFVGLHAVELPQDWNFISAAELGVAVNQTATNQVTDAGVENRLARGIPAAVRGIPIARKCHALHFLHSTGWNEREQVTIGNYVVHYADGLQLEIPIRYGQDVRNWYSTERRLGDVVVPMDWDEPLASRSTVAYTGTNNNVTYDRRGVAFRLFKTIWQNPRPNMAIESIDYISAMTGCAPFLIAITVE